VEGRFCAKCGAAVGTGAAASPPPAGPYASPVAAPLQENVAAALCYVLGFVTGIIFLAIEPYSKNRAIRFHAFQSIFLSVALIAIGVVLNVIFAVLPLILDRLLAPLYDLACFAAWVLPMIWAYLGKPLVLPVIGPLAQKQAQ
jgi:uncharacterized membrane protein